jgi:hypothetical protein
MAMPLARVALLVVAALLVGCTRPSAPPQPQAEIGRPPAPAPSASPAVVDSGVALTPPPEAPERETSSRCDARFPSAGTRYVETQTTRETLPAHLTPSFMLHGSSTTVSTDVLTVGPGGADDVTPVTAKETTTYDNGMEPWSSEPGKIDDAAARRIRQSAQLARAVVGARPLRAGASLGEVAKAVAAKLEGNDDAPPRVTAKVASQRIVDGVSVDVVKLSAHAERRDFATCHGLYATMDLSGELIARAEDGALIELTLSGPEVLVEDVCSMRETKTGPSRERVQTVRARYEFRLARDCFRVSLGAK